MTTFGVVIGYIIFLCILYVLSKILKKKEEKK